MRRIFLLIVLTIGAAMASEADVQTKDTPRAFPAIASAAEWQERSRAIREQILVSAGLWPMPEKTPLHTSVFGKIERDGYSVEKVYFESYPGFYVGGNLYRPLGRGTGPFPAVLNPHGHWEHGRLEDTAVCSTPGLCINFAKQGTIAFGYDMVGYNDTRFPESPVSASFSDIHHGFASNSPVDLLWNVTLMGLQTWDSIRALDFLESLPDVDKSRIACTGASGGGTQTLILGAVDDRLAAQAPVVMVSHFFQGGCECENMPGLRIRYSNVEIAAAPAPRPQILVSDTRDWTQETLTNEGPAIGGIYRLFGAPDNLRYVRFDFEHNYNQASRQAVYQWFDRRLLGAPDQPIQEAAFQKESDTDLRVFPDGALPSNSVSEPDLIKYMIQNHRDRLEALDPTNESALRNYEQIMRPAWLRTLQVDWPMEPWDIAHRDAEAMIKVTRFFPQKRRSISEAVTVVLVSSDGATRYLSDVGAPLGLAQRLLDQGFAVVLAAEPVGDPSPDQSSLFYTTYNRTFLQKRVRDLVRICQGIRTGNTNTCRVVLAGSGAGGLWCLLAAPAADAVIADCDQVDAANDDSLLAPSLYCPGIRNIDTFEGAPILASPHPLLLHNAATNFSTGHLDSCYRTLRAGLRLRIEHRLLDDEEIATWIALWGL